MKSPFILIDTGGFGLPPATACNRSEQVEVAIQEAA
jgi:hypothetical protein